jgi:glycosyltransferase involved in cell wall biosynthesis
MDRQEAPLPSEGADHGGSPPVYPGIEIWHPSGRIPLRKEVLAAMAAFRPFPRSARRHAVRSADEGLAAVVIDPALLMEGGHNYSALLRLKAELSKLDVDHTCLASLTADAAIRKLAAPVLPTKGLWWRSSHSHAEYLAHVAAMRDQLSLALNDQARPPDLLVLHCCDAVQVRAVAEYYGQPSPIPAPHLLIWLLFAPNQFGPADNPVPAEVEYREAFSALRKAIGDDRKISVVCETPALSGTYSDLTGLDVGVAPCPNLAGTAGTESRRREGRPIPRIVILGHANEAKGYHLLPEAIERVRGAGGRADFFVHGTFRNADTAGGAAVFDALSRMGPGVATSSEVLTASDYLARLGEADILLLPYDRAIYETRGSGLFNEAREIGIPVVATRGCAFAQAAFDDGWGVEIAERSGAGIAQAILDALGRLPDLSARATQAAAAYHGDDIGTVLRRVVGDVRPDEQTVRATAVKRRTKSALLPRTFFAGVHLDDGTAIRGDGPRRNPKLRSLRGKRIDTPPRPYCYAVLMGIDVGKAQRLPAGSCVAAEISVEVIEGKVGVAWIDENHQVLDDAERYAPAMTGIQRLMVPAPADRVRQLVFRNFASDDAVTSFRIVGLRARKWLPG